LVEKRKPLFNSENDDDIFIWLSNAREEEKE